VTALRQLKNSTSSPPTPITPTSSRPRRFARGGNSRGLDAAVKAERKTAIRIYTYDGRTKKSMQVRPANWMSSSGIAARKWLRRRLLDHMLPEPLVTAL